MKIAIATGTVYGGAKLVAEEVQNALENHGHNVVLLEEEQQTTELLGLLENDDIDILLICTSTTGAGDLPEDIIELHTHLVTTPPRVNGLKYAVIALGDSSYGDTFCGGGLLMDSALEDIGAVRLAEPLRLDAMETVTPEDDAVPWAVDLIEGLQNDN